MQQIDKSSFWEHFKIRKKYFYSAATNISTFHSIPISQINAHEREKNLPPLVRSWLANYKTAFARQLSRPFESSATQHFSLVWLFVKKILVPTISLTDAPYQSQALTVDRSRSTRSQYRHSTVVLQHDAVRRRRVAPSGAPERAVPSSRGGVGTVGIIRVGIVARPAAAAALARGGALHARTILRRHRWRRCYHRRRRSRRRRHRRHRRYRRYRRQRSSGNNGPRRLGRQTLQHAKETWTVRWVKCAFWCGGLNERKEGCDDKSMANPPEETMAVNEGGSLAPAARRLCHFRRFNTLGPLVHFSAWRN